MCLFLFVFSVEGKGRLKTISKAIPLLGKTGVGAAVDEAWNNFHNRPVETQLPESGNVNLLREPRSKERRIPGAWPVFQNLPRGESRPVAAEPEERGKSIASLPVKDFPFMPPPVDQTSLAASSEHAVPEQVDSDYVLVERAPSTPVAGPAAQTAFRRLREDSVATSTGSTETDMALPGRPSICRLTQQQITPSPASIQAADKAMPDTRGTSDSSSDTSSFDFVSRDEAEPNTTNGWTTNADRMLCWLWFFSPYSLTALAAILNYSCSAGELSQWLYGEDVKERLLQLMRLESNDAHAYIYHEIKRLFRNKRVDPKGEGRNMEKHLRMSWRILQKQLEKAEEEGVKLMWHYRDSETGMIHAGTGLDRLPESACELAGVKRPRWTRELRRYLMGVQWVGLRRPGKGESGRPGSVEEIEGLGLEEEIVWAVGSSKGFKRTSRWLRVVFA